MSNPTIKEIAMKANISIATVSRVINSPEKVAPATRKKILDLLREYDYLPNQLAKGLVKGKSNTFSLITASEESFFNAFYFREVFLGLTKAASNARYNILIEQLTSDSAGSLQSRFPVDGYILISPEINDPFVEYLERRKLPSVLINRRSEKMSWVDLDNVSAARTAVEHLIELGHRDIVVITGMKNVRNSIDRIEGYRKALSESGIAFNPEYLLSGDFHEEKAYKNMKKFLKKGLPVTAVFAFNDLMAIGAMRAVREAGGKVPEDVSVVGFDDMTPSSYLDPPLTTVRQPFYTMGLSAVNILLELLSGEKTDPVTRVFPGELVVRKSVAEKTGVAPWHPGQV